MMSMPGYSQNPRISAWVERWITSQRISTPLQFQPLAGDGSQRTFYRLTWGKGSRVLLSDIGWDLSKDYAPHQEFLASHGLPVPLFFEIDPVGGFLVMEDLGDQLLQFEILKHPDKKMGWLETASRLLSTLHGKTYPVPKTLPIASRSFDTQKYSDELKFTFDHLQVGYLGMDPPDEVTLNAVHDFCAKVSQTKPIIFAHRDYHCRNLLVKDEKLYLIDFQDARLGPPHYDLASLVYDAYVPMDTAQRNFLVEAYKDELKHYPLFKDINWKTFDDDLRRIAFQRVVKAAGSFASFFMRYGKETHLPYLVPALQYAESLLPSCPELMVNGKSVIHLSEWISRVSKKFGERKRS